MAEPPQFAEGHEHSEECAVLYAEWKRQHAVLMDLHGRFSRQDVLAAHRERDKFEHQLRLLGCSGEGLRRIERDREIAEHGRPLLG
ncbi:MAG: hypothetical protein U0360_06960 [Dehalococcoidia bacterium]